MRQLRHTSTFIYHLPNDSRHAPYSFPLECYSGTLLTCTYRHRAHSTRVQALAEAHFSIELFWYPLNNASVKDFSTAAWDPYEDRLMVFIVDRAAAPPGGPPPQTYSNKPDMSANLQTYLGAVSTQVGAQTGNLAVQVGCPTSFHPSLLHPTVTGVPSASDRPSIQQQARRVRPTCRRTWRRHDQSRRSDRQPGHARGLPYSNPSYRAADEVPPPTALSQWQARRGSQAGGVTWPPSQPRLASTRAPWPRRRAYAPSARLQAHVPQRLLFFLELARRDAGRYILR